MDTTDNIRSRLTSAAASHRSTLLHRRNLLPLAIIIISSATLSILAYYDSLSVSEAIGEIASNDIRSNAANQAHGTSLVLGTGIDTISTNLQILSSSPSIQSNSDDGIVLFDIAQNSTGQLTDFYMWLNSAGTVEWVTNAAESNLTGLDRSYREYFTVPLATKRPFFSDIIVTSDGEPRVYIAYPILDAPPTSDPESIPEDTIFKGVALAGIGLDKFGNLLRQESPSEISRNMLLVLDNSGTIIFAADSWLIGKSVHQDRDEITNHGVIATASLDAFSEAQRKMEAGESFTTDFSDLEGKRNTIASEPVILDGRRVWNVHILAPHTLTSDVAVLSNDQNMLSVLLVIVLGLLAFGILFFILSLNRRLEIQVDERTEELKKSNQLLEDSNKKLGHLNEQLVLANESLQINDRLQKEFINIASHEMRTPTQAILLHSDIVRKRPSEAKSVDAIIRNAERLQRLTNNILEISRMETQALKLAKERVDLSQVISLVIGDFKDQFKDKIQFIYEPRQVFVEADKARVTQVISNIIGNAIEFMKEGIVEVSALADPSGRAIIVKVRDEGPGIDPEIAPRLFTKFATKSDKGTGLGLFIAKSIVDAHGGKIWAEANTNGKGVTFAFRLPMSAQSGEET